MTSSTSSNPFAALRSLKKSKKSKEEPPNKNETTSRTARGSATERRTSKKSRLVIPKTLIPNSSNVIANGNFAMIGFREKEFLAFYGYALITPVYGSCKVFNYEMKFDTKFSSLLEAGGNNDALEHVSLDLEAAEVKMYPCYSPKTSSLLKIEASSNIPLDDTKTFLIRRQNRNSNRNENLSTPVRLKRGRGIRKQENLQEDHVNNGNDSDNRQFLGEKETNDVNENGISESANKIFLSKKQWLELGNMYKTMRKRSNIEEFVCIILIKDFSWSKIQGVQHMIPSFKNIFKQDILVMNNTDQQATAMAKRPSYEQNANIIEIIGFYPVLSLENFKIMDTSSWESTLSSICSSTNLSKLRIAICGSKNAGKSTFTRMLVNGLLSKAESQTIAYLDTDLGQCEFTPPGYISLKIVKSPLLGPAFTHQSLEFVQSIYLGMNSPGRDPDAYAHAVDSLINSFEKWSKQNGESVPLIVNTHGWTKGMGYDLLVHVLACSSPDNIICLDNLATKEESNRDTFYSSLKLSLQEKQITPVLNIGESMVISKFSSNDHRLLATISYFCQVNPHTDQLVTLHFDALSACKIISQEDTENENSRQDESLMTDSSQLEPWWDFESGILSRVPFIVPLKDLSVYFPFGEVPLNETLYALNGTLVCLCHQREDTSIRSESKTEHMDHDMLDNQDKPEWRDIVKSNETQADFHINYKFPQPNTIKSSILGIVRGVEKGTDGQIDLLILTNGAFELSDLQCVNMIMRCQDTDIPVCLYMKGASNLSKTAYTVWTGKDSSILGASSIRVRRNIQRKRLKTQ